MPATPATVRQAAILAALLGWVMVLGPSREASAAGCHVDDRPVFGLSMDEARPMDPGPSDLDVSPSEPVRVDRRCPTELPERPPSPVVAPVDAPILATGTLIPPPTRGIFRVDRREPRPLVSPPRIDRPPRP